MIDFIKSTFNKLIKIMIKKKESQHIISGEENSLIHANIEYLEGNIDCCYWDYEDWSDMVLVTLPPYPDEHEIEIDIFNEAITQLKTVSYYKDYLITDNYIFLQVNTEITHENCELYDQIWEINIWENISVSYEVDSFLAALIQYKNWYTDKELYIWTHYIVLYKDWPIINADITNYFTLFQFEIAKTLWLSFSNIIESQDIDESLIGQEISLQCEWTSEYPMECISDYVEAKKISNKEVKYVLFFRVLEYISVTSESIRYNEAIKPKLIPYIWRELLIEDIQEINSILLRDDIKQYTKAYYKKTISELDINKRQNLLWWRLYCNYYILSLLQVLDISTILPTLPESIYSDVILQWNIKIEELSEVLSYTRHKYSHATPEYKLKWCECNDEELEQLNYFIDWLVLESIKWYMWLPEDLKVK